MSFGSHESHESGIGRPGRGAVEIADVRQKGQELHVVTTGSEGRQPILSDLDALG